MQKRFGIIFVVIFAVMITLNPAFGELGIPQWVKNNAGWWADDLISDDEYVKGLEFMIKNGIMDLDSRYTINCDEIYYEMFNRVVGARFAEHEIERIESYYAGKHEKFGVLVDGLNEIIAYDKGSRYSKDVIEYCTEQMPREQKVVIQYLTMRVNGEI